MKRTRAQIRRSFEGVAMDMEIAGHRAVARRLRRYVTELFGNSEKSTPRKIQLSRRQREDALGQGLTDRDLIEGILND